MLLDWRSFAVNHFLKGRTTETCLQDKAMRESRLWNKTNKKKTGEKAGKVGLVWLALFPQPSGYAPFSLYHHLEAGLSGPAIHTCNTYLAAPVVWHYPCAVSLNPFSPNPLLAHPLLEGLASVVQLFLFKCFSCRIHSLPWFQWSPLGHTEVWSSFWVSTLHFHCWRTALNVLPQTPNNQNGTVFPLNLSWFSCVPNFQWYLLSSQFQTRELGSPLFLR